MESSSLLREMAENWEMLALFGFFIATVLWALRPGSRAVHRDSANIPFLYDDEPASDSESDAHGKEARS